MRVVLLSLLAHVGCTDYELKEREPEGGAGAAILVEPTSLAFGEIADGSTASDVFTITSVGTAALDVEEVLLDSAAFALTAAQPLGMLEPGASVDVVVQYTPVNPTDTAWVLVRSDDPAHPEVRVDLAGGGLLPGLSLDPPWLDFGGVDPGQSAEGVVEMVNDGDAALTVTSVTVTGDVAFSHAFGEPLPLTIEPGERVPVDLVFAPTETGRFTSTLWVGNDAPAGVASAPLSGASGVPVAVCSATPDTVQANAESVTFDGSGSYDPGGRSLVSYAWTLISAPPGSAAFLPSTSGERVDNFRPDLAGVYEASLVVTNDLGMTSDPCLASVEAIPGQDLWIEMFWDHSGDDMDLHLLRPGGSLRTQGDCYYANCVGIAPDWGVAGDPMDDPSLDIDDIPGTGPENINVWAPEDGDFEVYVHDYPGSYYSSDNAVTVRIYVGGILAWEDTRDIGGEDDYVPFARVSWPDGAVTDL